MTINFIQKRFFFSIHVLALVTLLCFGNSAKAQKFLLPETLGAQYAGSIGYGSVSFGYCFFKDDKGTLDFSYGYVPESKGGALNIGTIKFAYRPLNIKVKEIGTFSPLNPGTFVSYDFDQDIKRREGQYPDGYYWWNEAIRVHLSLSNEFKFNTGKFLKHSGLKNISVYSEFNTNDLYAVSWFKNRDQLSFIDIIKVGYGVRVYF